jgi:hypothetical protein
MAFLALLAMTVLSLAWLHVIVMKLRAEERTLAVQLASGQ